MKVPVLAARTSSYLAWTALTLLLAACGPERDMVLGAGPSAGGGGAAWAHAHATHKVRGLPRASRSAARPPVPRGKAFLAWATLNATLKIIRCESSGNPRAVSQTRKYRGLLQMDAHFWATYGGLAYAPRPDAATRLEQLHVGYRGWLARGWRPWTCARLTGVAS